MGQVSVQSQMLVARTIRVIGRSSRAIEEHARLIRLLANRDSRAAQHLMEQHILSALQDILRYGLKQVPPE
jgi:DNA-binding GntR family transcriptional regulator